MIDLTSFEVEITDPADVFLGPERGIFTGRDKDDGPYLFVVLPSFCLKVRLNPGNLKALRSGLEKWQPR